MVLSREENYVLSRHLLSARWRGFILFVPSFRVLVQWDPKRAREGSSAVSGIPLRLPYPILQDASVVH